MNGPSEGDRWFEKSPERLEAELAAFEAHDLVANKGEDSLGRLVIETEVAFKGEVVPISVVFPSDYPYFAPRAYGPAGLLARHQQPRDGNFCVTPNTGTWWRPDYPASWIVLKLQALLDAEEAGTVTEGEANMPEPLTGHLPTRPDLVVFVGDAALQDDLGAKRGSFSLAELTSGIKLLTSLSSSTGPSLDMDSDLASAVGLPDRHRTVTGEWIDLDEIPAATEWAQVPGAALEAVEGGARSRRTGKGAGKRSRPAKTTWVGVTWFEEGPARGELRRAWFFYEIKRASSGDLAVVGGGPIETQALSQSVRRERTPELSGLESASFLIVGAGSLGGPLAVELAKADAGEIALVDGDTYDLNNSVRHVLPTMAAGRNKAAATTEQIRDLNPFVRASAYEWSVGDEGKQAEIEGLVNQASVVVDATGSHSVVRLLQPLCAAADRPLVSIAMSPGAFGGRVLTLRGTEPCLDCFLLGQDDASIPTAPALDEPGRTPYACSQPAASGAGFDVTELVALAARAAVQATEATGYPSSESDWIVVSFRDRKPAERYQEGELINHDDCPWCG